MLELRVGESEQRHSMRKNILILGHNYATQFIDIYNQYTALFDSNKYDVTVAYLTGLPSDEVRARTIAEQVIFLNLSRKSIRNLKTTPIKKLLDLCKDNNYEIIICHRYKPTYIMMWVAQFYKKIPAIICVMHELRTMSSLKRQFLITCLRRKNMLLAGVSNAVRDDMRKNLRFVPKEGIATLYNMIDIDQTEPQLLQRQESRKALKIADHDFVFGHIARLVPNKNQECLILAFERIRATCPHVKLVIIGDGELELRLKELVAGYGLSNDVIFTGFLPKGFRYMKAFDCFVLPSIQEAFGRVLLEAMIAKLPIIATHVHGIPEVVKEAGILIKSKDVSALATAMKQIYNLSHTERTQFGEKAYQHAKNHFSIPRFYEQFMQLPLIQSLTPSTVKE